MRFLTNLMVVASLVFVFIFLQDHYDITARAWQYWIGAPQQSKGSAPPNPGVSAIPADHNYQLVIDVSGKSPFMQVVHGSEATEKKISKKRKKPAANPQATTKDQPQATLPQQATPQPVTKSP